MKIKRMLRFFKILIIAIAVELVAFNLTDLIYFAENKQWVSEKKELSMTAATLINWEYESGEYISQIDPIIVFENINTKVNNINIEIISETPIQKQISILAVQNGETVPQLITTVTANDNTASVSLGKQIQTLRLDIGEEAGTRIQECKVIINPDRTTFSISRVVAMILIYYMTLLLFSLQKSPEYKISD